MRQYRPFANDNEVNYHKASNEWSPLSVKKENISPTIYGTYFRNLGREQVPET